MRCFALSQAGNPKVLTREKPAHRLQSPHARRLFSDANLSLAARLLDDWFRIPGTSIRFGLDGFVGLVPGLGDILAGMASCIFLLAAWVRGVPYITIVRMIVNVGLDVVVGTIPLLGDVFDIAWKANRRNYRLLVSSLERPRRQAWRDWAFLLLMAASLAAIFLAPVLMVLWAFERLRGRL